MNTIVFLIAALIVCVPAAPVKWTGQGGTPLWDFARNWDCNCIPGPNDDVMIDVPFTPVTVRIGGSNASCNSLSVGGISPFSMQLIVQGQLSVGNGGGKISANGQIILDSSSSAPFSCSGQFNADRGLVFNSGSLSGPGSFLFSYVNLTGPALKVFNSKVTVTGSIEVQPGAGSTGVIDVQGGVLSIPSQSQLYTTESLILSVFPKASFNVSGSVVFAATGPKTFTFRGFSNVANLTAIGGNVVVNDASNFNLVVLNPGSTLTLIGAPETARNFGSVTGTGTVIVQGGTNAFTSLTASTVQIQSGTIASDSSLAFGTLTATGGVLEGQGQVSVQSASIQNLVLNSIALSAQSLNINGFSQLNGAKLTITSKGVIGVSSQLTMSGGATFTVTSGATISQSSEFKLLPSGTDQPPLVTNNGQWTSTAPLTSVVNVKGTGSWNFGQGSSISVTAIAFSAGTLSLTGASFIAKVSVININNVQATQGGTVDFDGQQLLSSTLNVNTYIHNGGDTVFDKGQINLFTILSGSVNLTNTAQVSTLDLRGGSINGVSSSSTISASNTTISTNNPKTLTSITITSPYIAINCPHGDCQLFTSNSVIVTPSKK